MAKNLWKFEPREKVSAEPFGSSEVVESPQKPQSVGAVLRECREERGEDLRYVAQMLRIRYPYLKAIEDGLVDDLPGRTYAIGFVRTYAEHLGLDAKDLVSRFKAEVEGLNARNDLNFPAPIPEGKIPSGAILLVGIVIAALIYAIWIYASSKEEAVSRTAPQPPANIASVANEPAGTVELPVVDGSANSQSPASPDAGAETVKTAPENAGDRADSPPAGAPAIERPAASPEEPKKSMEIAAPPITETQKSEPEPRAEETAAAASPPSPPAGAPSNAEASPGGEAASPASETGKVYGEGNANARIVLHAVADSWVEVRDKATDELLLTRVLFKGDSFRVPDRSGLTLLTGNAGGLRITVDGDALPPLGAIGSVRRDVALEPDQLKSGARRVRASDQSATTGVADTAGQ